MSIQGNLGGGSLIREYFLSLYKDRVEKSLNGTEELNKMGAQIHIVIEVKKNDVWEALVVPYGWGGDPIYEWMGLGRNDLLYSFLGTVFDSEVTPWKKPVGFPDDMSPELRSLIEKDWGDIMFGVNWFTLAELKHYNGKGYESPTVSTAVRFLDHLKYRDEEIRIILWFDN